MGWLGPDQEVIERLERIERRLDDVDAELGRHLHRGGMNPHPGLRVGGLPLLKV